MNQHLTSRPVWISSYLHLELYQPPKTFEVHKKRKTLSDMISTHYAIHTLYFRFDILDTAALSKVSTSLDKDHISSFVMKYSLHILIFLWYWSLKKGIFLFSMLLTTKRVGVFAKNIRLFRKLFPKQWKLTTFTSCFVMLDSFLDNF